MEGCAKDEVLIAFGDAQFDSCSPGHPPGPVKGFRHRMGVLGTLLEHRTSCTCCKCGHLVRDAVHSAKATTGPKAGQLSKFTTRGTLVRAQPAFRLCRAACAA